MNAAPSLDHLTPTLERGIAALGLHAAALTAPLMQYLTLLHKWNGTYNLTAVRDPAEMIPKHLLDSLSILPYLQSGALADLGTGPGLPGIPVALARPDIQVTLVESNGKKARFMREAIRTLKLDNARVAESRIEAVDEPGAYTQITARALATLSEILAFGGHLLGPEGRLLAMKARTTEAEAGELPAGWVLEAVHVLQVPDLAAERELVVVRRG
ncbi:16S rRNA (guanine(527)-N(7))-methyltransferase RsmG [Lysobacter sp. HDW10]|uniref:16S rRNA (guanine(527)-N(7))-methyltransferase RsmG n=1 Tax=Lysobacter sp. HDW10 TaxID=2714936 RepID=UPI0014078575|nr:16S rRNA (guanine(527)-N(7))-methyltransferase RsmG [Lysobacter sp. HDW10]QIK80926.1 16S rRNA (guanine(527)-N(7))-methyltransferase RsmG [Lysobacter sp. HDW10]